MRFLKKARIYVLPDGHQWDAVRYARPFTVVFAVTEQKEIILIEQWRFPAERQMLLLPGGGPEGSEELEDAIRRELLEETGYQAGQLEVLMGDAALHPAANTATATIYFARDCKKVAEPAHDPVERIAGLKVRLFSFAELRDIIARGDRMLDMTLVVAFGILAARGCIISP